MARIVLGLGSSHSPLLVLGRTQWGVRAADDQRSTTLNTLEGRTLSYAELVAERGTPHADRCTPEQFHELGTRAEAALDRLAAALRAARPDIVLVVGDDQGELFDADNLPAISIFCGDELVMRPHAELDAIPPWANQEFWAGYRMDLPHRYPGAPALAEQLIEGLVERGVDIASARRVPDKARRGFGHAFGFVIQRLIGDLRIPMLPVLLNTYFPPNTPTAARCFEIGGKLAEAIAAAPSQARVAIVASGGLSHFLCEEAFDREVIAALRARDATAIGRIPQTALRSGSSEIRNWIVAAGALGGQALEELEYLPVYRTPAGTGIGLAFARWS